VRTACSALPGRPLTRSCRKSPWYFASTGPDGEGLGDDERGDGRGRLERRDVRVVQPAVGERDDATVVDASRDDGTAARLPALPGDSGSGTTPAGHALDAPPAAVVDVAGGQHPGDVGRRTGHRLHPAVRRRRRDHPAEDPDELVGHLLQAAAVDDHLHERPVDLLGAGRGRRPPDRARLRWHLSRRTRQIVGNISHAAGG
jgi:hypothetical protein